MRSETRPQFAKTPGVLNLTLVAANTEYSQELPDGLVYAEIHARQAVDVRVAWATGAVAAGAAAFFTMKSGDRLIIRNAKLITNRTIYMASSNAGTVVEFLTWSV